jgi:hypothetical protein
LGRPLDNRNEKTNPGTYWFWNDWSADNGLRACGVAEKGLWFEMLGIMARSNKKGLLLDGDKKMDNKTLAKIVGESEAYVDQLLNELRKHGVFSETADGIIYNRRMAREESLSTTRSEAGKKGMESRWKKYQTDNKAHNKPITSLGKDRLGKDRYGIKEEERIDEKRVKGGGKEGKAPDPADLRLTQLLVDLMQKNNPNSSILKGLTEARQAEWMSQCRLLREADGKSEADIEKVIRFSQSDGFWKTNILSMPKLREKWDQLWLKASSPTTGGRAKERLDIARSWCEKREASREREKTDECK